MRQQTRALAIAARRRAWAACRQNRQAATYGRARASRGGPCGEDLLRSRSPAETWVRAQGDGRTDGAWPARAHATRPQGRARGSTSGMCYRASDIPHPEGAIASRRPCAHRAAVLAHTCFAQDPPPWPMSPARFARAQQSASKAGSGRALPTQKARGGAHMSALSAAPGRPARLVCALARENHDVPSRGRPHARAFARPRGGARPSGRHRRRTCPCPSRVARAAEFRTLSQKEHRSYQTSDRPAVFLPSRRPARARDPSSPREAVSPRRR